jgi:hypothetical protein
LDLQGSPPQQVRAIELAKEYGQGLGTWPQEGLLLKLIKPEGSPGVKPHVFFDVECVFFALVRLSKFLVNSR